MKKKLFLLLFVISMFFTAFPVNADEIDKAIYTYKVENMLNVEDESEPSEEKPLYVESVYDYAGVINDETKLKLREKLQKIKEEYNVEVAIVTDLGEMEGSAEEAANDEYTRLKLGYGENKDGILLYISKTAREFAYVTDGYGKEVFNWIGLKHLDGEVTPYLKNNDYNGAVIKYVDVAGEMIEQAKNGKPYGFYANLGIELLIAIVIALIIAVIMLKNKLSKMKTVEKALYANKYMKHGSFKMEVSKDIFMYSMVTRTAKPKEKSGSGGSGSRGGRSGSF